MNVTFENVTVSIPRADVLEAAQEQGWYVYEYASELAQGASEYCCSDDLLCEMSEDDIIQYAVDNAGEFAVLEYIEDSTITEYASSLENVDVDTWFAASDIGMRTHMLNKLLKHVDTINLAYVNEKRIASLAIAYANHVLSKEG